MGCSEYTQYLSAKKSIDDQSLNRHVWHTLKKSLPKSNLHEPLEVLEIGGGIGTMFQRLVEWQLTPHMNYVLTEPKEEYLNFFWQAIVPWSKKKKIEIEKLSATSARLSTAKSCIFVSTIVADGDKIVQHFLENNTFHLLVANGVFDLLDIELFLPDCFNLLNNSGLLYASINYEGRTDFFPLWPNATEGELLTQYHDSMQRNTASSSPFPACMSASRLISTAINNTFEMLAAGSSDWVIHPKNRQYTEDESFFLNAILDTIWMELVENKNVDQTVLKDWISLRQKQLNENNLIYFANNVDLLFTLLSD